MFEQHFSRNKTVTHLLSHILSTLQWRYNERDGVSNHRRLDCLLSLSRADQRKHQSSPWPVDSPNKGPVTRKMESVDDVMMLPYYVGCTYPATQAGYLGRSVPFLWHAGVRWLVEISSRMRHASQPSSLIRHGERWVVGTPWESTDNTPVSPSSITTGLKVELQTLLGISTEREK